MKNPAWSREKTLPTEKTLADLSGIATWPTSGIATWCHLVHIGISSFSSYTKAVVHLGSALLVSILLQV